jgi:excisionase family DNA binding protein
VAEVFKVPVSQIYSLARQSRIPSTRLGKYVRFNLMAVQAALARGPSVETVCAQAHETYPIAR